MSRIGILGGTFNPPHIGHLVCAQDACDQLGLGTVLLVPVHSPPHKDAADDPGPAARLLMCRLAAAGDEHLEVSPLEVDRGGPSYTVATLRALHDRSPEDELTFIVGADMAMSFADWREPAEILRLARLAVAGREGVDDAAVTRAVAPFHDGTRLATFAMPRLDVSSSMLRRRIAEGRPVRHLIPDAVLAAIEEHGWYRDAAVGAASARQEVQG